MFQQKGIQSLENDQLPSLQKNKTKKKNADYIKKKNIHIYYQRFKKTYKNQKMLTQRLNEEHGAGRLALHTHSHTLAHSHGRVELEDAS